MPGLGRLSVWAAGDVARCEMDSVSDSLTVKQRRDSHTLKRQECQLWDATNPYAWNKCPSVAWHATAPVLPANTTAAETGKTAYQFGTKQPNVHCLACMPKASGCDTACKASELTTRHTLWGCVDARLCAAKEPKAGNEAAWKPWTLYVAGTVPNPDIQGEAYRVVETPLTTPASTSLSLPVQGAVGVPSGETIPCIDYKRAYASKLNLRTMWDLSVPAISATGGDLAHESYANPLTFRRTYVCASVTDKRAYSCKDASAAASILTKCLKDDGTAAGGYKPGSTDKAKSEAWYPVVGALGWIVPTFAERFPNCLAAKDPGATAKTALNSRESWDAFETLAAVGLNALWQQHDPAWKVAEQTTRPGLGT